MLFISRKNLDAFKESLAVAIVAGSHETRGLKVTINPSDETLELVALNAMSLAISMTLGRPDTMHPSDVHEMSSLGGDSSLSQIIPPKLD